MLKVQNTTIKAVINTKTYAPDICVKTAAVVILSSFCDKAVIKAGTKTV